MPKARPDSGSAFGKTAASSVAAVSAVQSQIGYSFKDASLLVQALTHPSYSSAHGDCPDNQRLEFLGDSVLGMLTAEHVYGNVPDGDEGILSVIRTQSVSGKALAEVADEIGLSRHLLVRGGAEAAANRHNLADAVEAIFGAAWIDGGAAAVRGLFERFFIKRINASGRDIWAGNPKGKLQALAQRRHFPDPVYTVVSAKGPSHAMSFRVEVLACGKKAAGAGGRKQAAEAAAASEWLRIHCGGAQARLAVADGIGDGAGRSLHAMGVTGIGVSGVSVLMKDRGWKVSGCDEKPSPALASWLRSKGVEVVKGHSPSHLAGADMVVYSPAVADDSPELAAARASGAAVVRRGELLSGLVNESKRGVAVCGTHGKTTTSCFSTLLLRELGDDPSWCIGGFTPSMGGVAGGGKGPLVVEADESDGTLALYKPSVTAVTSIDADHMEHFDSFDGLCECFGKAVAATSKSVVYCADNKVAAQVARDNFRGAVGYGFSKGAEIRACNLRLFGDHSDFNVVCRGQKLGRATIGVPGRHNVLNALGAFGVAVALGHAPEDVFARLGCLRELPGRRFERMAAVYGAEMVSDYSHHPAEIAALVATAKLLRPKRLLALFQPHRYSRTKALARDFPQAFAGVDELLLLPVYAASEKPLHGGSSDDLYREFREQGASNIMLAGTIADAREWLLRNLRKGDLLLVVGAGDVVGVVDGLSAGNEDDISKLAPPCVKAGEPMASRTSLGVGGEADFFADAASIAELRSAIEYANALKLPLKPMGAGTNLLVPDTGARGMVLHLSGAEFSKCEIHGDVVEVGAACPGAALLAKAARAGLSGIEFMVGIPGSVGGWLAMNAGVAAGSFGDAVESFTAVDLDTGAVSEVEDGRFAYRACGAVEGRMVLSVRLRLRKSAPSAVRDAIESFRRKRFDFAGLRTAGSAFKNPEGTSAGRLSDKAGCKGLRVGGAFVCDRHANIVAAGEGATASDVQALMSLVRDKVQSDSGIRLEAEIKRC